jgi:hypothetical protein
MHVKSTSAIPILTVWAVTPTPYLCDDGDEPGEAAATLETPTSEVATTVRVKAIALPRPRFIAVTVPPPDTGLSGQP